MYLHSLSYTSGVSCSAIPLHMYIYIQPIPPALTFLNAVSKLKNSQLECLIRHVSVKRDVRALNFEL